MILGFALALTACTRGGSPELVEDTVVLLPDSAGDLTDLVPDPFPGTNWQHASDSSDTTFNKENGEGTSDLYQLQNLPGDAVNVVQVDLHIRIAADNAAGGWAWTPRWRLSAVDLFGTLRIPSTTPSDFVELNIARPGGGAWTVADVNALQAAARADLVDIPLLSAWLIKSWLFVTYEH